MNCVSVLCVCGRGECCPSTGQNLLAFLKKRIAFHCYQLHAIYRVMNLLKNHRSLESDFPHPFQRVCPKQSMIFLWRHPAIFFAYSKFP